MNQFPVIKHPLDVFSFSGNVGELNEDGRNALDLIMMLISDMRFSKGRIGGTCARYFLLIDNTWVPKNCFLAHLNCTKMREYLWRCEFEETDGPERHSENSQIALLFPERERWLDGTPEVTPFRSDYGAQPEQEDFRMASILLNPQPALR